MSGTLSKRTILSVIEDIVPIGLCCCISIDTLVSDLLNDIPDDIDIRHRLIDCIRIHGYRSILSSNCKYCTTDSGIGMIRLVEQCIASTDEQLPFICQLIEILLPALCDKSKSILIANLINRFALTCQNVSIDGGQRMDFAQCQDSITAVLYVIGEGLCDLSCYQAFIK